MSGISRKLPEGERQRLKQILKHALPEDAGVIVRTAAEGATEDQLTLDVERLKMQWETINSEVAKGKAPTLLHSEPDLLVKIIRDALMRTSLSWLFPGKSPWAQSNSIWSLWHLSSLNAWFSTRLARIFLIAIDSGSNHQGPGQKGFPPLRRFSGY